jgi:hypothetical protein
MTAMLPHTMPMLAGAMTRWAQAKTRVSRTMASRPAKLRPVPRNSAADRHESSSVGSDGVADGVDATPVRRYREAVATEDETVAPRAALVGGEALAVAINTDAAG